MRAQAALRAQQIQQAQQVRQGSNSTGKPEASGDGDITMADGQDNSKNVTPTDPSAISNANGPGQTAVHAARTPSSAQRQPWEYVEEIVSILKSAFPLLSLTLETIQDQLKQRFKPSPEEDLYRVFNNAVVGGINVRISTVTCSSLTGQSRRT